MIVMHRDAYTSLRNTPAPVQRSFLFQIRNSSLVWAANGSPMPSQIPQPGKGHPHSFTQRAAAVNLSPYPFFRLGLHMA